MVVKTSRKEGDRSWILVFILVTCFLRRQVLIDFSILRSKLDDMRLYMIELLVDQQPPIQVLYMAPEAILGEGT